MDTVTVPNESTVIRAVARFSHSYHKRYVGVFNACGQACETGVLIHTPTENHPFLVRIARASGNDLNLLPCQDQAWPGAQTVPNDTDMWTDGNNRTFKLFT